MAYLFAHAAPACVGNADWLRLEILYRFNEFPKGLE